MNKKYTVSLFTILALASTLLAAAFAFADAPKMSKEELRSRLSDKNIAIIDVRTARDWELSSFKIRGASREDPQDVVSWAKKYPQEKTIVFYCA